MVSYQHDLQLFLWLEKESAPQNDTRHRNLGPLFRVGDIADLSMPFSQKWEAVAHQGQVTTVHDCYLKRPSVWATTGLTLPGMFPKATMSVFLEQHLVQD